MTSTTLTVNEQALAYLQTRRRQQPFWERDLAELRREMRQECRLGGGDPEPVAAVEEVAADGVPARLYRPSGGESDVFVWMHGGGWMLGDLDCVDRLGRTIANRAACAVLTIDYRLAPEHRFPAAIDDAWTATCWAADYFDQVAVGGDSAGGNLAAAVALRCRDHGVALAHQLLVYAALDSDLDSEFCRRFCELYRSFGRDNDLGVDDFGAEAQAGVRRVWEMYVPDPLERIHPYSSPAHAPSLAGVAAATIITAEHDILRGDSEAYAGRLRSEGVPVELLGYEGQLHGFFYLFGLLGDARDAVERAAASLRRSFAAEAGL